MFYIALAILTLAAAAFGVIVAVFLTDKEMWKEELNGSHTTERLGQLDRKGKRNT
jgi:predicted outer membrane lipoprotein